MRLRNSLESYGAVSISLHWIVAIVVVGLFGLGFWMVELTYYDSWYKKAPDLHRSTGLLLFAVMIFRVIWRACSEAPSPLKSHSPAEIRAGHLAHLSLYVLIFIAMASGYLISTADGSSISVFDWFEVPSVTGQIKGMEEIAGSVHYWSTWALVGLAGLHALAALKHHFFDRDLTLKRMLRPR